MANYVISQEVKNFAVNAESRIKKGASKFYLKNCIKIIDAMCKKDGKGKNAQVGSLTLVEALEACCFRGFSTQLLTFMDAERTKMIAFVQDAKVKEASKLGALVEEAYALTDGEESDLTSKVTEAYEHLQAEKQKEAEREAKRKEARDKELQELTDYFVANGMDADTAPVQAAMCRIIKGSVKDGKAMWAINDLFASFAYTKADELAAWAEQKKAAEDAEKAKKEADRAAKKAERDAKKAKKDAENKNAFVLGVKELEAKGITLTDEQKEAFAAAMGIATDALSMLETQDAIEATEEAA